MLCGKCKEDKPEAEFSKNNQRPRGYQHYCKKCSVRVGLARYHADPIARNKALADGHARYVAIARGKLEEKKRLGICYWCERPSVPSQTRCMYHLEKAKREQIARTVKHFGLLRKKILDVYGRQCECCGENMERFLTIDHVNNDGKEHRKTYSNLYRWLIKNGFPRDGFQVLCMNCNWGKQMNGGVCPHKQIEIPAL